MRPAQVPHQWRKISATRVPKPPSASMRRRLKSKAPHSNLLHRLLVPRPFSKWLTTMAMALDRQALVAAMQTPMAKLADNLRRLVQMQTDHPELLPPTSLPGRVEIDTRHTIQEQKEGTGLADEAVAWMLAPVFFCCVVAEKAKPPQTWEATEVFSRVVVSFMLKLFVLVADLTGGEQQKQVVRPC